jgi:hypothetical protein
VKVVRNGEAQLASIEKTESQRRFRKIKSVLALPGYEQAVFYLEVTPGNDDAGIGNGRAVGGNYGFRVGYCLSTKGDGSEQE